MLRTATDTVAPHFSPFHPGADPSWPNSFRRQTGYYDYMWHMKQRGDPAAQYTPRLAESLEYLDDVTIVVKLKQANFHDNPNSSKFNAIVGARQLSAEDVAARYAFMQDAENNNSTSNGMIQNSLTVTAVDASTVRFDTDGPQAFFLEETSGGADYRGTEVPQEMLDETVLKEEPPIGTGPFMFERYQVGSQEKAVRNVDYWLPDRPFIDRLQMTILPDNAAQEAAFRANQLDIHGYADIKEAENVKRDLGDEIVNLDFPSDAGGQTLMLNIRRAPFNDIRFREAIYRAIDREKVIRTIYFGDAQPWTGLFGPHQPEKFPVGWDALSDLADYDPERARQLVQATKDDGTYDGRELVFMLPVEAQTWVDGGTLVAEDLQAVGINVRTEAIVRNIYLGKAGGKPEDPNESSDFDITMTVFLQYHHHHSNAGTFWNNNSLEDPEIDALIDKISVTVDTEERAALSNQLERMSVERYTNYIPVLAYNEHVGHYAYIKGVDFDMYTSGWGFGGWQIDTWLDEGRAEA